LRLKRYFRHPGDGRKRPQIPARALLWAMLVGQLIRDSSAHAIEALVCSPARRALGVRETFGDDTLGYFTERLDAAVTRQALSQTLRQARRKKVFDDCRFLGLAVDGSTAGRCRQPGCTLCRPYRNSKKEIVGYRHHFVMVSVVGVGLTLPFDVEPYGPGDSEYAAGQRLLQRAVDQVGKRFADYVVADGEFATAPFLHTVGDRGLHVVARLKGNLPELFGAAQQRFGASPPDGVFEHQGDRIEYWDADDFDPWESLRWSTVRVLRYRQHKPEGTVVEAYWLTDFSSHRVGSHTLYHMAKSRWEIENQGFNDAKNRHGLKHLCHHHANSILMGWLLTLLALVIERLYRLRYLHRGLHPVRSAIEQVRLLRLSLGHPQAPDTS
jgi:DDE family transposase